MVKTGDRIDINSLASEPITVPLRLIIKLVLDSGWGELMDIAREKHHQRLIDRIALWVFTVLAFIRMAAAWFVTATACQAAVLVFAVFLLRQFGPGRMTPTPVTTMVR